MIDLKVDLNEVKRVKKNKADLFQRLNQIDFDQSGLISLDSFLSIANKHNIELSSSDIQYIKDNYKRKTAQNKIDYIKTLNNIKMRVNNNG